MSPFATFTSWYWLLANALRSGTGELVTVQGIFEGSIVLNRPDNNWNVSQLIQDHRFKRRWIEAQIATDLLCLSPFK